MLQLGLHASRTGGVVVLRGRRSVLVKSPVVLTYLFPFTCVLRYVAPNNQSLKIGEKSSNGRAIHTAKVHVILSMPSIFNIFLKFNFNTTEIHKQLQIKSNFHTSVLGVWSMFAVLLREERNISTCHSGKNKKAKQASRGLS